MSTATVTAPITTEQIAEIRACLAEVLKGAAIAADLDTLEIVLNPEWSSETPGYREAIREGIAKQANVAVGTLSASPPNLDEHSASISHAKHLGGFAIISSLKGLRIGLDLEQISRVSEKVVGRMASASEMKAAPSLAHLWGAKESTFKALRGFQKTKVTSEILVSNWRQASAPSGSNLSPWSYRVARKGGTTLGGVGLSVELSGTILSIFIFPTST